jgi:hypothetical protein
VRSSGVRYSLAAVLAVLLFALPSKDAICWLVEAIGAGTADALIELIELIDRCLGCRQGSGARMTGTRQSWGATHWPSTADASCVMWIMVEELCVRIGELASQVGGWVRSL